MLKKSKHSNKFIRLQFMRGLKMVVGLFPHNFKVKLRKQIWLRNLYSKNLQRSGLFFGFPSPERLQKQYVKNIAWQESQLKEITTLGNAISSVGIVTILSGDIERDLNSIQVAQTMTELNRVYVISDDAFFSNIEKRIASNILNIRLININADTPIEFNSLLIMRSGDILHKHAIASFLYFLSKAHSNDAILYCDCDYLDKNGQRHKAQFYPDWNPDLQLSSGYIRTGLFISGEFLVNDFKNKLATAALESRLSLWLASLYLSEHEREFQVIHIPYVLLHQTYVYSLLWHECVKNLNCERFTVNKGQETSVASIEWKHNNFPLVSIIIPTKNAQLLVQTCIESILNRTEYPNYEILLIDNNSDDAAAIAYFDTLKNHESIRVLSYPHPFNYSAINNFAVQQSKGEVLALVNNDIEVITANWLSMMVGHVLRSDIGCVGAKLLYPDGRVQHAGVVMGYGGGAGHAHKYFPRYHPGYQNRLIASHNFSAVTGACLLVKKSDYNAIGGLNETLTVAFNDIDFCLRILELGRRNLYCAEAVLFHHESVSRGAEDTHEKVARFEKEVDYLKTTWKGYIEHDPAYNPNLTLRHENFSIKEYK